MVRLHSQYGCKLIACGGGGWASLRPVDTALAFVTLRVNKAPPSPFIQIWNICASDSYKARACFAKTSQKPERSKSNIQIAGTMLPDLSKLVHVDRGTAPIAAPITADTRALSRTDPDHRGPAAVLAYTTVFDQYINAVARGDRRKWFGSQRELKSSQYNREDVYPGLFAFFAPMDALQKVEPGLIESQIGIQAAGALGAFPGCWMRLTIDGSAEGEVSVLSKRIYTDVMPDEEPWTDALNEMIRSLSAVAIPILESHRYLTNSLYHGTGSNARGTPDEVTAALMEKLSKEFVSTSENRETADEFADIAQASVRFILVMRILPGVRVVDVPTVLPDAEHGNTLQCSPYEEEAIIAPGAVYTAEQIKVLSRRGCPVQYMQVAVTVSPRP